MILVIGNGICAANTAKEILAGGNELKIASKENLTSTSLALFKTAGIDPAHIITDTKILSCRGCAGDFTILMGSGADNAPPKLSTKARMAESGARRN